MMARYKPSLVPPAPPRPMDRARDELAAHLAATPDAAATIRLVLATLDVVRSQLRDARRGHDAPEAFGCSRGATVISEAAMRAWPDFTETPS